MKTRFFNKMLLVGFVAGCLAIPQSVHANIPDWTTGEFSNAFDEVARNYGAVEYATYTFMIEYGIAPSSLDELRDTGHLNVQMANPYTDGDVLSLTSDDYPDGDLEGNILVSNRLNNGREVRIEAWFLRRNADGIIHIRSMVKRISLYESEIDRLYFFDNDLPREEQFVAIYCRQAIDAFESFEQRNGRSAEDFGDMYENGDVNVRYINPITGEIAVSSGELSAGDFYYEKIGEDGFYFIGWGRERPVFFASTDEDATLEFYLEWPELLMGEEESVEDEDGNEDED